MIDVRSSGHRLATRLASAPSVVWAVALSLGLAPPAFAGENLMLEAAKSLCAINHGNPTQVLSTADATGWRNPARDAAAGGILDKLGMKPNVNWRTKDVGTDHLVLNVKEMTKDSPVGLLRLRTCSLSDDGPAAAGLSAAMRDYYGREPNDVEFGSTGYLYDDAPDGRRFLSTDRSTAFTKALVQHAVVQMATNNGGSVTTLIYRETSKIHSQEVK